MNPEKHSFIPEHNNYKSRIVQKYEYPANTQSNSINHMVKEPTVDMLVGNQESSGNSVNGRAEPLKAVINSSRMWILITCVFYEEQGYKPLGVGGNENRMELMWRQYGVTVAN